MARTFTGLKLQGDIGKFGKIELSDVVDFAELPDGKVSDLCPSVSVYVCVCVCVCGGVGESLSLPLALVCWLLLMCVCTRVQPP